MTKLYIIGNGFDLWHGIPTSYDQFYEYAKGLLNEIETYYTFDMRHAGPWSDFENSLGCFEWEYFYDAHYHIDPTSDSFRPSEVYGLEDDITEQADNYVEAVKVIFSEWVDGIDITIADVRLDFPSEASFLNFNYTSTLQSIYGIDEDKVLHIHGRSEKYDELVFGHGETREEEPEIDENGDSNRTMFSDAQGAAKYPFYAFQKPVGEVIEKNQIFFDSLKGVREIIVIGHSLNKIDLPYFKRVAEGATEAEWLVCCYEEADEYHHVQGLLNCGVPRNLISTCTYDELQALHR